MCLNEDLRKQAYISIDVGCYILYLLLLIDQLRIRERDQVFLQWLHCADDPAGDSL